MKKYKLLSVEEINEKKRFRALFSDGTITYFGQTNPTFGTYIDNSKENKKRKENYILRHRKDLETNDPKRAGFLSMFLLWNKSTLQRSIIDYNKRIKSNNWTLP